MSIDPPEDSRGSLVPHLTFQRLVSHPGNQFALAVAHQLSEVLDKRGASFGPIFIHGRSGQGKTHLLHAMGNNFTDGKVLYLTCQDLERKFIESVAQGSVPLLKYWVSSHDLVLLDNFDYITSKPTLQATLQSIIMRMASRDGQLVAAGLIPPYEVPNFDPPLLSQLESGLIAPLYPADTETLIKILRKHLPANIPQHDIAPLQRLVTTYQPNIGQLISQLRKALLIVRRGRLSLERAVLMVINEEPHRDGASRFE